MIDFKNYSEYRETLEPDVKKKLDELHKMIKEEIPQADEVVAYGMPGFKIKTNIIFFCAFPGHIGIYPAPSGVLEFLKYTDKYKTSKGAIQIPINEELPLDIIKKVVQFRIKEDEKIK